MKTNGQFPVHLQKTRRQQRPKGPLAYVVGSNGAFVHKRNPVFRALVPVERVLSLEAVEPVGEYLLPPLPALLSAQILRFFKRVARRHKAEAIVLIAYHPARGEFRVVAPEQEVSGASCDYTMPRAPRDGWRLVGTVHSHVNMSAFHSCTDTSDERAFDGIHATFGRLDESAIEIVSSLAVGGHRFPVPPAQVFSGFVSRPVRRLALTTSPLPYVMMDRTRGRNGDDDDEWDVLFGRIHDSDRPLPTIVYVRGKPPRVLRPRVFRKRVIRDGWGLRLPPDVPVESTEPPAEWFEAVTVQKTTHDYSALDILYGRVIHLSRRSSENGHTTEEL